MKGRFCLTNLISSYDKVTHLMHKGKAVDVVYPDFSLCTVSHSIFVKKLAAHGLDKHNILSKKTVQMAGPRDWRQMG